MEKNVGGLDRLVRFVLGPLLVVFGLGVIGRSITVVSGTLGIAVAALAVVVGAILLTTAMTRTCPANALLGVDTYGRDADGSTATEQVDEELAGSRSN